MSISFYDASVKSYLQVLEGVAQVDDFTHTVAGRPFRLTDVYGNVIKEILA